MNTHAVIADHFARRWHKVGLIDDSTVLRIVEWEAANRRPVVLWAVASLGAIAVSLGVMAIVGANWEYIPAWVKLAANLALNALAALAVFIAWRQERLWLREIAALLLFALVLSGIALIGQIYQLQSAPWRALVLWLAIVMPFLALTAFSRLNGVLWAVAVVVTWFAASDPIVDLLTRWHLLLPMKSPTERSEFLFDVMTYGIACLMIVASVLRGFWRRAESQADLLLKLSLAGLIVACSITVSFVRYRLGDAVLSPIAFGTIVTVLAAIALWRTRSEIPIKFRLGFIAASFVVWVLGVHISTDRDTLTAMLRALLFILYWSAIGGAAAYAGWRGWFGFAFTVVGLRLLILYFEAIGGLTATGVGLIGGGVLCLALAALGWRLTRGVGQRAAGATA